MLAVYEEPQRDGSTIESVLQRRGTTAKWNGGTGSIPNASTAG